MGETFGRLFGSPGVKNLQQFFRWMPLVFFGYAGFVLTLYLRRLRYRQLWVEHFDPKQDSVDLIADLQPFVTPRRNAIWPDWWRLVLAFVFLIIPLIVYLIGLVNIIGNQRLRAGGLETWALAEQGWREYSVWHVIAAIAYCVVAIIVFLCERRKFTPAGAQITAIADSARGATGSTSPPTNQESSVATAKGDESGAPAARYEGMERELLERVLKRLDIYAKSGVALSVATLVTGGTAGVQLAIAAARDATTEARAGAQVAREKTKEITSDANKGIEKMEEAVAAALRKSESELRVFRDKLTEIRDDFSNYAMRMAKLEKQAKHQNGQLENTIDQAISTILRFVESPPTPTMWLTLQDLTVVTDAHTHVLRELRENTRTQDWSATRSLAEVAADAEQSESNRLRAAALLHVLGLNEEQAQLLDESLDSLSGVVARLEMQPLRRALARALSTSPSHTRRLIRRLREAIEAANAHAVGHPERDRDRQLARVWLDALKYAEPITEEVVGALELSFNSRLLQEEAVRWLGERPRPLEIAEPGTRARLISLIQLGLGAADPEMVRGAALSAASLGDRILRDSVENALRRTEVDRQLVSGGVLTRLLLISALERIDNRSGVEDFEDNDNGAPIKQPKSSGDESFNGNLAPALKATKPAP